MVVTKVVFRLLLIAYFFSDCNNVTKENVSNQKIQKNLNNEKTKTISGLVKKEYFTNIEGDTLFSGIKYGKTLNQTFDFTLNRKNSPTLVILIHGGSWIWGNNKPLKDLAHRLSISGYNVANLNYRLCSKTKSVSIDSQITDIKEATICAEEFYNHFVGMKISKTYIVGVSAGGHLALLSTQMGLLKPNAIVAISPPTLLHDFAFQKTQIANGLTFERVLNQCMEKENIKQYSIDKRLLVQKEIPILITHGTLDKVVPIAHSRSLVDSSKANIIKLLEFPMQGHTYKNMKDSLTRAVIGFINNN